MLTACLRQLKLYITRIRIYKRTHVAYWAGAIRRDVIQVEPEYTIGESKTFHSVIADYRFFIDRTLSNYNDDINKHRFSIDIESVLQRCVWMMRQEMSAEADRLFTCLRASRISEERFKSKLRQIAEEAVFDLQRKFQLSKS